MNKENNHTNAKAGKKCVEITFHFALHISHICYSQFYPSSIQCFSCLHIISVFLSFLLLFPSHSLFCILASFSHLFFSPPVRRPFENSMQKKNEGDTNRMRFHAVIFNKSIVNWINGQPAMKTKEFQQKMTLAVMIINFSLCGVNTILTIKLFFLLIKERYFSVNFVTEVTGPCDFRHWLWLYLKKSYGIYAQPCKKLQANKSMFQNK